MSDVRRRVADLERAAGAVSDECECGVWNQPGVGWRVVHEVHGEDSEWARAQVAQSDLVTHCEVCGRLRPVLRITYGEWEHRPGDRYD